MPVAPPVTNARLRSAFDPFGGRALVDAVLGVLTGFVWDDVGLTGAKRAVKGLEGFIDEWNRRKKAEGKDVRLVQVRRAGFMALDCVVPDPGIMDVVEDEGRVHGEGGIGPAE